MMHGQRNVKLSMNCLLIRALVMYMYDQRSKK
jgi:hypothetical protein